MKPSRALALALAVASSSCNCGLDPSGGPDGGNPDGGGGPPADAGTPFDDCDAGALGAGVIAASGLGVPRRFALDGTDLYISEAGSMSTFDGQVLRLPLDGGQAVPLATGFRAPDAIAADPDFVYVVDSYGLWRIAKSDGTQVSIDPQLAGITNNVFGDTEVRVSGGRVVVATGLRGLVSEDPDGGSRAALYGGDPGTLVRGAAIEGSTVFFLVANATDSGLFQVPIDGSAAPALVSSTPTGARSLALTADEFLWTEGNGGAGRVMMMGRDAGSGATVLASGLSGPTHPVRVGQFVYFKDSRSGVTDGFFRRVALCSPGTSRVVGPTGVGPGDLAFDGTRLWYSSADTYPNGVVGHVP